MSVKTKCVYDEAEPDDGFRLLVMRFWPRGVRKDRVDGWEKELGAPKDLIKDWKSGAITWAEFSKRYRTAMREQQGKIAELAERANKETITLLCSCREGNRCHRFLLKKLIAKSG
ncbi:MAG: DUF488 family protein [Candidatus Abyssobacteria bacterium SURF_17]|uniref:DUF488 family protein n=1 Tax=Candidatus Abyssobacteria bacterium SURF_17 TaxID=2093361 RepID=A0A419ERF5_9BACT|nr:MAG: DUF488 family protein [Candidatus Abyssubacteria bacterium SURF_17]